MIYIVNFWNVDTQAILQKRPSGFCLKITEYLCASSLDRMLLFNLIQTIVKQRIFKTIYIFECVFIVFFSNVFFFSLFLVRERENKMFYHNTEMLHSEAYNEV